MLPILPGASEFSGHELFKKHVTHIPNRLYWFPSTQYPCKCSCANHPFVRKRKMQLWKNTVYENRGSSAEQPNTRGTAYSDWNLDIYAGEWKLLWAVSCAEKIWKRNWAEHGQKKVIVVKAGENDFFSVARSTRVHSCTFLSGAHGAAGKEKQRNAASSSLLEEQPACAASPGVTSRLGDFTVAGERLPRRRAACIPPRSFKILGLCRLLSKNNDGIHQKM